MKFIFTCFAGLKKPVFIPLLIFILAAGSAVSQQTSLDPTKYIYALTDKGEIYAIDVSNATAGSLIKDATYDVNPVNSPNGLAYNVVNGKFYYQKRDFTSTDEFVSFDPATNKVQTLQRNTLLQRYPGTGSTVNMGFVTGCISNDGQGYYMFDEIGSLYYYSIPNDAWTLITANLVDQNGVNLNTLIKPFDLDYNSGDLAIDGLGNLWLVISSAAKYGVYILSGPLPTTTSTQPQITIKKIIDPSRPTPSGSKIGGIAFNPRGQIFLADTKSLYLLKNTYETAQIGSFTNIGTSLVTDLTSANFPSAIPLPITWKSFDVSLNDHNRVILNWQVEEQDNKGFYVEESKDGRTWNDLTFIPGKNISGIAQQYSYAYTPAFSGILYYRIKQVDIDGKESFSDTKKIIIGNNAVDITIWPNPAHQSFSVNNKSDSDGELQIFDISGKLMLTKKIRQKINTVDISSLSTGMYLVKAGVTKENYFTQIIIKQ